MNYKILQFTYQCLFDLHHRTNSTDTVHSRIGTHTLWTQYLNMIRAYFIDTEIIIHGNKQKIQQVNSFGGKLVLSYKHNVTKEVYNIDLEDL